MELLVTTFHRFSHGGLPSWEAGTRAARCSPWAQSKLSLWRSAISTKGSCCGGSAYILPTKVLQSPETALWCNSSEDDGFMQIHAAPVGPHPGSTLLCLQAEAQEGLSAEWS